MNTALASVHPARATGSLATDGVDDPGTAHFAGNRRSKRLLSPASLFVLMALGLCVAFPGYALDLVAFTGITGPLTSALTQIASLGPGIKADKHPAFAVHWLYWHLPTSPLTAMRATPPSHIRRMVG